MAEKKSKNLISWPLDERKEFDMKSNGQNEKETESFSFLQEFNQYCEDKLLE